MSVNKKDETQASLGWYQLSFERYVHCMCVVSVYYNRRDFKPYVHPHTASHKQIPRWNSTYTEQGFNSFCITSVHRTSSTVHDKEKKGGKHKPSVEEYVPFEVVLLLGTRFGVTRLAKQIIKRNGWGGLQSFISDGKNKVPDDLGDSGVGFDGNSHACWNSLLALTDRCYHKSRVKELLSLLYVLRPKVHRDTFWQIISTDWRFSLR